jgi:hypothetical protein
MRHGSTKIETPPNDPNELNSRITEGKQSFIPSDPSQLNMIIENKTKKPEERDLERIYRLIPKLGETLPEYVWPQIIKSVIEKLWSYPRDSIIIQFLSKLSLQLSNCSVFVISVVISKLKDQTNLSSQFFSQPNSFLMENMIFERLAPLLVLKMLTINSFKFQNKEKEYLILELIGILKERSIFILFLFLFNIFF